VDYDNRPSFKHGEKLADDWLKIWRNQVFKFGTILEKSPDEYYCLTDRFWELTMALPTEEDNSKDHSIFLEEDSDSEQGNLLSIPTKPTQKNYEKFVKGLRLEPRAEEITKLREFR